jgi:hypothetical protein
MKRQLVMKFTLGALGTVFACFAVTNAQAYIAGLEAAQQNDSRLYNQWKFEGSDDSTLLDDSKGATDLVRTVRVVTLDDGGTPDDTSDDTILEGLPGDITFEPGIDPGSQAYRPSYADESVSATAGAGLTGTNWLVPTQLTVEAVVRPDAFPKDATSLSDVTYIFQTRPGNDRGYFLIQDNENLSRNGLGTLSTVFGNAFGNRAPSTEYTTDGGEWFYFAATFDMTPAGSAIVNTYVKNLTTDGPLLHPVVDVALAGADAIEGLAGNIGVGAFAVERDSNQTNGAEEVQEYFKGAIENVATYRGILSPEALERHSRGVPEPASLVLLACSGLAFLLFRRRAA